MARKRLACSDPGPPVYLSTLTHKSVRHKIPACAMMLRNFQINPRRRGLSRRSPSRSQEGNMDGCPYNQELGEREGSRMADNGSILVTGAAGQLGAVGRTVTGLLLDRGLPVRAMVRREDDRAAALR